MTFQSKVNRQFTPGFIGEVIRDGVLRARPGRIVSATLTNMIGLVYGYDSETGAPGRPEADKVIDGVSGGRAGVGMAAEVDNVTVGGAIFFGILSHPKHYALQGTAAGTLEPTLQIPQYHEGEFVDCCTGLVVPIYGLGAETTGKYGAKLQYATKAITATGEPAGAISLLPANGTPTADHAVLPNAFLLNDVTVPAGASDAASAVVASIRITN